jgi:transcription initiation factor IIE alpha subunit
VVYLLYRSMVKYNKKADAEKEDKNMTLLLNSNNADEVWDALKSRSAETLSHSLSFSASTYKLLFEAFAKDSLRPLRTSMTMIIEEKALLKKNRRLETRGMQRIDPQLAYERSTWYYLCTNSSQQMLNTLSRIAEPMKEHAEHSFSPLSSACVEEFSPYCRDVYNVLVEMDTVISTGDYSKAEAVSVRAKELKHSLAGLRKKQTLRLHQSGGSLRVDFVYLNLIQESHELLSEARNLLRGGKKFFE